jgi:hypothetical protein
MEVKIIYSKPQLEAAVRFIARNNEHFRGQKDFIRDEILKHMKQIAADPESWSGGTMGYHLLGDRTDEGIDNDENSIMFDILVDPNLGYDLDESDYAEEVIVAEEHLSDVQ